MKAFALRLLAFSASTLAVIVLAAAFLPLETEAFLFARRTSEHDTYRRIPEFREWARTGGPELLILAASIASLSRCSARIFDCCYRG